MQHSAWIAILVLVLTACATAPGAPTDGGLADSLDPTGTPVPEGTDLPIPTDPPQPEAPVETAPSSADKGPGDTPPAGAASQFTTDFAKHTVPYDEILSGGPPKDGIPALDTPAFVSVEEASEWLEPQEPVIQVGVGEVAKAYPVQILMWHEIVNDVVGDSPVTVTFCPLCNTGIAFDRTLGDQVLDFGTTGRLRRSNLIMYDRQTETWWQQATGEGIAGEHTGRQLAFVPASMISWDDFREAHPDGRVLSRDTGYVRSYGRNPYAGYDDIDRSPFLYDGPETPGVLPPMARVVTVELNDEAVAYPYDTLREERVVNDVVGGVPVAVLWAPGTASALDAGSVAGGADVGAATTFARDLDGKTLSFVVEGDRIVDEQTGTQWNVLGRGGGSGQDGPLAGRQLEPVVSINHFWFSWAAFRPETRIYGTGSASAAPEAVDSPVGVASVDLDADFVIELYQGEDVLGGPSVAFSKVLGPGKPVVLNFWAGLCPICRNEMPELQRAYERYGDQVIFLGVDVGQFVGLGTEVDAQELLHDLAITYPTGSTRDARIMRDYEILGTPATYFVAPSGDVVERWNGLLSGDRLVSGIEDLIALAVAS